MSDIIGLVSDAMILSGDRRAKVIGGLHIEFKTERTITSNQIVQIKSSHYFKVNEVKIEGNNLVIRAHEVGYWSNFLSRKEDFDLRSLLDEKVTLVTNKEELAKVHEMSCWC